MPTSRVASLCTPLDFVFFYFANITSINYITHVIDDGQSKIRKEFVSYLIAPNYDNSINLSFALISPRIMSYHPISMTSDMAIIAR